jgi:ankyrin repeat protein
MLTKAYALSLVLLSLTAYGHSPLKSETYRREYHQAILQEDSQSQESAFIESIKKGDTAAARRLLDDGVDPNMKDEEITPLFIVILKNNLEIVQLLLDRGVDPDAKVDNDNPALGFAALLGRAEIVRILLERGADVNAEDDCSNTPLREATFGARVKSQYDFFLQSPEWLSAQENPDETEEYMTAFGDGHAEIVWMLITRGAKVNIQGCSAGDFGNPLWDAALAGDIALAQLLLAHGADPAIVDIASLDRPTLSGEEEPEEIKADDSESVQLSKLESRLEDEWWRSKATKRAQIIAMFKQTLKKKEP